MGEHYPGHVKVRIDHALDHAKQPKCDDHHQNSLYPHWNSGDVWTSGNNWQTAAGVMSATAKEFVPGEGQNQHDAESTRASTTEVDWCSTTSGSTEMETAKRGQVGWIPEHLLMKEDELWQHFGDQAQVLHHFGPSGGMHLLNRQGNSKRLVQIPMRNLLPVKFSEITMRQIVLQGLTTMGNILEVLLISQKVMRIVAESHLQLTTGVGIDAKTIKSVTAVVATGTTEKGVVEAAHVDGDRVFLGTLVEKVLALSNKVEIEGVMETSQALPSATSLRRGIQRTDTDDVYSITDELIDQMLLAPTDISDEDASKAHADDTHDADQLSPELAGQNGFEQVSQIAVDNQPVYLSVSRTVKNKRWLFLSRISHRLTRSAGTQIKVNGMIVSERIFSTNEAKLIMNI